MLTGLSCITGLCQTRTVTGTVEDSVSHTPLANISVRIQNGSHGVLTNQQGKFTIHVSPSAQRFILSATGYQALTIPIPQGDSPMIILLAKSYLTLQDVVVTTHRRGKYRNKNNPAVELIREVIAHKAENAPGSTDYSSYQQYEKTRLLLDRAPKFIVDNKLLKRYHFMFENRDTTIMPGRTLVPVYIEEVFSNIYNRKHPEKNRKLIAGHKGVDYGEYIDMRGVSTILNRLYEDINVYENTITAFTMQFVGPVAEIAPTFYMYFIRDTIVDHGEKLIQLYFTPRNPEDLLFRGTMYITLDGHYAIRRIVLGTSKRANLNWIHEFNLKQDFEKDSAGHYHLANSDIIATFSPFAGKPPGVVGERMISIDQFQATPLSDSIFKGPSIDTLPQASQQRDSFWTENRLAPLSSTEAKTYSNTDSLVKMKSYRRLMDYITVFTAGYKSAGKVDIGPIGSFSTFNPIEGQRFRFGGRTNTKLSTRIFSEDYIAYGQRDNRWKFSTNLSYAFNHKSIFTFPLHYIQVSYQNEVKTLGAENAFASASNFFTSFSHGDNSKWLYNHIARLSYVHEYQNKLTFSFGVKYWQQSPTGTLQYIYKKEPSIKEDTIPRITTGELTATIRWAPKEQFFQNKVVRVNVANKYPIISLQYTHGVKGLFGGEYNSDALHLNVYKRCYLAPLGFTEAYFDAGFLRGNLPFPLLIIHPANPSYFYSLRAYNLMNVGEFISDHYASINADHFFNGFFLNKIPLLKKLRLREVIGGKILYGGLSDKNNPNVNPNQMKFPLTNGVTSSFVLGGKPYVEGSIGIYNILNIFRVDVVKRFTYLDHPNVSSVGIRVSSNFNF
ncbi:MAG: carboxypeptidase-like regulatory domain-containing protein [Bacteroidetes bacterium]|nr:carboxypeptidase-like regulatory domain-containing protein [Bacteroidota bacterium]